MIHFDASSFVTPILLLLVSIRQVHVMSTEFAIDITGLNFEFPHATTPSLIDVDLHLPKGSRCILIGANGGKHSYISLAVPPLIVNEYVAGKSTLLQILAGKRLVSGAKVNIKGCDVFRNSPPGVTFLGTEWYASLS